jgi:hypothetical protein
LKIQRPASGMCGNNSLIMKEQNSLRIARGTQIGLNFTGKRFSASGHYMSTM